MIGIMSVSKNRLKSFHSDFIALCRRKIQLQTLNVVELVRKSQSSMTKQVTANGPGFSVEDGLIEKKNRKKWKRGKQFCAESSSHYSEISETGSNPNPPKKKKFVRPNFFLAVQVTDSEVLENVKKIQQNVLQNSPVSLNHMKIDPLKSHLTLMVMNLPDSSIIKRAVNSLELCVPPLLKSTNVVPVTLEFEGLSVFNNGGVLFAKVKPSPGLSSLHEIANAIRKNMEENDIEDLGKGFTPHMTLMKYRRKRKTDDDAKRIDKELYADYENIPLGSQTVSSIQLCRMESDSNSGYYKVEYEVFF